MLKNIREHRIELEKSIMGIIRIIFISHVSLLNLVQIQTLWNIHVLGSVNMKNGFITFWSYYFQGNDNLTEKSVKELKKQFRSKTLRV